MSFSLKTLKLLQDAGVHGASLYAILASVQEDFGDTASPRIHTKRRISRRRRLSDPGWADKRAEVFSRDNRTCQYCGETDLDFPTVDHVHPLSRGGSNLLENLVTACEACNGEKANMTMDEWNVAKKARLLPPSPERKPYTLKSLRSPRLSRSRCRDRDIVDGAVRALRLVGR